MTVGETSGQMLARMGVDGYLWAREFCLTFDIPDDGPGSAIHTWFANAIEAGISEGHSRERRRYEQWPD